jgi:alkyl hydroperoxide reductase subunit AhpC
VWVGGVSGDRVAEFRAINCEVVACSVDSKFSHYAWTEQPRREGGLGPMNIPILADITKKISRDYGVLIEDGDDAGVALRGLFVIGTSLVQLWFPTKPSAMGVWF